MVSMLSLYSSLDEVTLSDDERITDGGRSITARKNAFAITVFRFQHYKNRAKPSRRLFIHPSVMLFPPAQPPPTLLGRYRTLGPKCGIRVSPLQLGCMSIGDKWANLGMGAMDKESSVKLLDAYFDAGGNFLDTSSNYQDESSEEIIGEWAEKRGIRDQLIIATKYSIIFKRGDDSIQQKVNYSANSLKTMHLALEASLKKLRTSYVDILYLHLWDWECSVEEIMNGLHNLVTQGKVLYLGVSNTPAWVVAKANQYARDHGKTPFVIYQCRWNCMNRSFERELLPMCISEGIAIAPFGVLSEGRFRTKAEDDRRRTTGEKGRTLVQPDWEQSEDEKKISAALEKVAKEVGAEHITAVALAYVLCKAPYVFPIIGGRKIEHLMANIEALKISLTQEQIDYLASVVAPMQYNYPYDIILYGEKDNIFIGNVSQNDKVPARQAIRPSAN